MLFDNLKISRKLAIGFTAVTLTMAGMGGAMLVNLRVLDNARLEIKEGRETLVALNEAKFYLTRQENSYRGYLLTQNNYYIERVDRHRANFKQRLDTVRTLVNGAPDLLAKLDIAAKGADRWHAEVVEAGIRLSADPATLPQAEAMVGPDGLADQVISPVEDAMDAILAAEMAQMEKLQQLQVTSTRNAYASLVVGLTLAVMIAIGLGMLLTRMIAGPVKALTAAMRRLAQGDFTAAIPAMGRKDEVGQMAEAVSVFKEAGIEK